MPDDPDMQKIIEALSGTEPLLFFMCLGSATIEDIQGLLRAFSDLNEAYGGKGFDYYVLDSKAYSDGVIVHTLAACPAVPEDEVS